MASFMTHVLALASMSLLMPQGNIALGALTVPRGSEPALDGVMGEDEWGDAALVASSGTARLLAKIEGDTLFLGLRGVGPGVTTVGLAPDGATRLRILHASASLGTAEYERDGVRWKRTRAFSWGAKAPPGSAAGDAARATFRDEEGWLGTLATMGTGESEMAIDVKAVHRLRCAIGHLGQPALRIPEGAVDDLFGLGLQMGTAPDALASDPGNWLDLEWTDPRPDVPALAGFRCLSAGTTWVYCSEQDDADVLVADVVAAASEFERYFGRAPEPGAVVAASGALPPGCDAQLRAAGARWILPWLSLRQQPGEQDSVRAQIETQLRAQLEPLGMNDEEIKAQLEQVMAKLTGAPARGGLGLLRHELGHVWFVAAFWPARSSSSAPADGHYGGPAADWLDESAAILLESEEATAHRRSGLREWLAANPGRMRPLDELFTMTHPLLEDAAVAAAQADAGAEGSAIVRVELGPTEHDDDCPFYEQCRSLADYLLATAGKRVFASIAAGAARGEDMARWLAAEGPSLGLPATNASLQAAWLAWLEQQPSASTTDHDAGSGR